MGEIRPLKIMKKNKNFLVKNILDSISKSSKGTILRSMAIFTAIELCGSFLTGNTGPGSTKNNFLKFCRSNYFPRKYHSISELLYIIFRNGVAHSYIAKGSALLSSNYRDKSKHLKYYKNGLFIYVPELANNLRDSIKNLFQDIKNDSTLRDNYNRVIEKLGNEGNRKYRRHIADHNIRVIPVEIPRDINTNL